ncbi:hypothetical protein [Allomuricauda sp. SCSIO 65647]|uniref:hypothetical protein n=1 Tax=Allomuricauda sp. SCSIO 65647 TaxID=2908843 RepID=UPI0039187466
MKNNVTFLAHIAAPVICLGTTFIEQMTPWFFAMCLIPAINIIVKMLPETKGKTLEEKGIGRCQCELAPLFLYT